MSPLDVLPPQEWERFLLPAAVIFLLLAFICASVVSIVKRVRTRIPLPGDGSTLSITNGTGSYIAIYHHVDWIDISSRDSVRFHRAGDTGSVLIPMVKNDLVDFDGERR